jgi:hypothetical protein
MRPQSGMNWGNLLSPAKVLQALRIEGRAVWALRHGLPDVILQFLGGLGDELLLTCVAHELHARNPDLSVWQISAAAELLRGNPDYSLVLDRGYWELRHSNVLGLWRRQLSYSEMLIPGRYEVPPREHILACLCRGAGLSGRVQLRPWISLSDDEVRHGRHAPRQVALQCVGQKTHETWMANKVWYTDRSQEVVDGLARKYPDIRVVQLGTRMDPALRGVLDLRGATSLRQTAAVLCNSECFIGTSGFLAHLARAVDCRSVVIYGGREHSWQSGYPCNENLESHPPCSPCWLWHDCDFDRRCMRDIGVTDVLDAVARVLARWGTSLEVQDVMLAPEDVLTPKSCATVAGSASAKRLVPMDCNRPLP